MARKTWISLMAIVAGTLVGCGGTTSSGYDANALTGAPYPVATSDPYNSTTYPTPGNPPAADTATPVPVPSVAPATDSASPAPVDGTTTTATDSASPLSSIATDSTTALRIVNIDGPSEVLGFCDYIVPCFKAKITSISVQNPLMNATQTGHLLISFSSSGTALADPLSISVSLPPAAIQQFGPFEATDRSDAADAQVVTDGQ